MTEMRRTALRTVPRTTASVASNDVLVAMVSVGGKDIVVTMLVDVSTLGVSKFSK